MPCELRLQIDPKMICCIIARPDWWPCLAQNRPKHNPAPARSRFRVTNSSQTGINRMKLKTLFSPFAAIGCLLTAPGLQAQQYEAHVHGLATLTIAVESKVLELQFESPANNLVGFEHKASTKAQRNAVISAKATLSDPATLFGFFGTSCKAKETEIDVSAVMDEHDDSHDDHKHHDHHDEHKHHDSHDDHSKETHSEIKASYKFSCKDTNKFDAILVNLFKAFPGIEEINTIWITASKQGSEKLNKQRNTVSFK